MASIEMDSEEDATGKAKEIYDKIKETLGIEFVPNMYKVMAHKPDYLEVLWNMNQAVMKSGKLDPLTKEIVAEAVSAVSGCDY